MCGIVGYVGPRPPWSSCSKGCGDWNIAATTVRASSRSPRGKFAVVKAAGRIACSKRSWPKRPLPARSASATPAGPRTAPPTDENAHPHLGGNDVLAIVHNGVIENFRPLKERLESEGYIFRSATDSEVIAHLIASCLEKQNEQAAGDAADDGRRQRLRTRCVARRQQRRWRSCTAPTAWRSCSAIIPTC